MSQNSKIIEYFYREFRANNIDNIYSIISPNFAYYINGGAQQSYEQLAERMKLANQGATVIGKKMTSEDDVHYSAEFEVQVVDSHGKTISAFGFTEVQIYNGLITSLDVHYYESEVEIEEFRELIKNNATALV